MCNGSIEQHVPIGTQLDALSRRQGAAQRQQGSGVDDDGVGRNVARQRTRATRYGGAVLLLAEQEGFACPVFGEFSAFKETVQIQHAAAESEALVEIKRGVAVVMTQYLH